MAVRRILVFTGNRADYGPLLPLLRELEAAPGIELHLLVSGSHLSGPRHSYGQIVGDGFTISGRVEMLLDSDTPLGIAKSMALGGIGYTECLEALVPDVVVILGDRHEAFAMAHAAVIADVPIAHIGGGEATAGVVDESLRHAITKLSHLHFVAAEPFRRRVVQMGEDPARVWVTGALGVDSALGLPLLDRPELERELGGVALERPVFLVTYHPVVRGARPPHEAIGELLAGLDAFPDATAIFTHPNVDAGSSGVRAAIEAYAEERADRAHVFASLGQLRYLSLVRHADVVIGNSSSGIIEAPSLGTPTVNVGQRQAGRLRAPSVLDAPEEREAISRAVRTALAPAFASVASAASSPYGGGGAAEQIASALASAALDGIVLKRFHDLPTQAGGPQPQ